MADSKQAVLVLTAKVLQVFTRDVEIGGHGVHVECFKTADSRHQTPESKGFSGYGMGFGGQTDERLGELRARAWPEHE